MGYRSEVKICTRKRDLEELRNRFHNYELKENEDYFDRDFMDEERFAIYKEYPRTCGYDDTVEDVVVFGWDWIKWYMGYPEIDLIEDFLDELDEKEIDYSAIRIGEELEDMEERGHYEKGYCEKLHIYRGIDVE